MNRERKWGSERKEKLGGGREIEGAKKEWSQEID